jgi:hypothetical protein
MIKKGIEIVRGEEINHFKKNRILKIFFEKTSLFFHFVAKKMKKRRWCVGPVGRKFR